MIIAGFDVETIPDERIEFDPESVKYGNMKDPDKRAAKLQEVKEAFAKNLSVNPATCQVCTFVGVTYDTEKKQTIESIDLQWGINDDEWDLPEEMIINEGWDFIKRCYRGRIPLVSFNGIGFDLPVMFVAAMRLDVAVENATYQALTNKWEGNRHHYDLMLMLSGWNRERWEKLNFWLKRFDIGQKTEGMDGSQVWPAFQAGEYKKILEYCKGDVLSVCKLMVRVAPWLVPEPKNIKETIKENEEETQIDDAPF